MKLLNAFLIAAVSVVAAACSKNEPVKIIETPAETVYSGTMTVVAGGKDNVSENVKVNVNLQEDGTATIIFNKVKFVPQMPSLWMLLFPESSVKFAKMRSFFQATTSFRWPWECLMQNIK